jgi:hypothetical protein
MHVRLQTASKREAVSWLMYGCKFVSKLLELLGDRGNDTKFIDLYSMFERIESSIKETTV